jgi:hypothetical protein
MAFERFSLWQGEAPVLFLQALDLRNAPHPSVAERVRRELANLSDTMLAEFRGAFARGDLEAGVREPGSPAECAIPPEAWTEAFFPERVFLADDAPPGLGAYFDSIAGRTPFIRLSELQPWLADKDAERAGPNHRRSPTVSRLVDLLIGLASDGIASSTEVEAWLDRWGLPSIAGEPPPRKYDPSHLSDWTLPMTVMWIVCRDIESVRRAQDEYRANSIEWHGFRCRVAAPGGGRESYEVHGEEPKPPRFLTLGTLRLLEAIGEVRSVKPKTTVFDARAALWRACGDGKLTASAIDSVGSVTTIPRHEWAHLEHTTSKREEDCLMWSHDHLTTVYRGLKFQRSEILAQWPPSPDSAVEALSGANVAKVRPGTKLNATCEALQALYPDGVPQGLVRKELLKQVNGRLQGTGNSMVEMSTLLLRARRALEH